MATEKHLRVAPIAASEEKLIRERFLCWFVDGATASDDGRCVVFGDVAAFLQSLASCGLLLSSRTLCCRH